MPARPAPRSGKAPWDARRYLSRQPRSPLLLGAGTAEAATELRYTCYGDGNECEVMREQLDRFEAENPDITVVMDKVPYKAILESLPVQLAAGEGPDLARVTDLGGLSKYYPRPLALCRPRLLGGELRRHLWPGSAPAPDDKGIYGMMTQLTITGPYINKTLFEQAGVEVPGEGATWDEWAEAAREVAKATETPFPMAIDRSGHRLAGPAISKGAKFFDADGKPQLVDEGFSETVTQVRRMEPGRHHGQGRLGRPGRLDLPGRGAGVRQRPARLLLLRQLAGRPLRERDRRRLRLGGGGAALRPGRLHRHAGRRRPRRLQVRPSIPRRSPR